LAQIIANTKTTFTLDFDGQVPVQIRRSGIIQKELVVNDVMVSQNGQFDFEGWHANPPFNWEILM
jgi:hypothetical protein